MTVSDIVEEAEFLRKEVNSYECAMRVFTKDVTSSVQDVANANPDEPAVRVLYTSYLLAKDKERAFLEQSTDQILTTDVLLKVRSQEARHG